MSSPERLRPLAKCGVVPGRQFGDFVTANVKAWVKACRDAGLVCWDIAAHVGVHRSTIHAWEKASRVHLYAESYVALKDLAAECASKRKTGT